MKRLFTYDDDVVHELHKIAKKIAMQMKNPTFSGKDPMSLIVFLQEYKSACGSYRISEGT